MRIGIRSFVAIGIAALGCASLPAHSQTRSVFEDFATQMTGSDHSASLGPDLFGDSTDLYSGATRFLVTDVSLPGNSDLPVALQRSLEASDTGLECFGIPQCLPHGFMTWTRFEVPYLSGVYPGGWVSHVGITTPSDQRCSLTNGPPEIPDDKGSQGEWQAYEYWHGNHFYLPGAGSQLMLVAAGGSPPTDGQTYRWVTKDHWYFSCLPTTANGQPGEAFLARSPDGKKYYFDHLVNWRPVELLRKFDDEGDEMVMGRDEYRMLLTRVEDRFGNWVQYTYSGTDLTSITANDGRQLTLTYAAPGGALTSASDGTRTWTYNYSNGVRVTFPDSTVSQATVSGGILRPGIPVSPDGSMSCDASPYTGEATLTIQHRSGAVGTFVFRPLRRGLSHVFYTHAVGWCPQIPKHYDNIALYSKTISGAGFPAATWSYVYGPANGCLGQPHGHLSSAPCTTASPTTRYVEVSGPGTFTRYTFGNRWQDSDGALFRIETGSSPSLILRDEALTWQTFQAPGGTTAGSFLSTIVRTVATRTIAQGGATYATTNSNWDLYFNPQTVAESGPNGGSRTTQHTYHNDRAKWVIGQVATSTSPGRSISRTFNANALVSGVTEDGVATSYTYNADGTLATATDPRSGVHSFSNYKRGIAQSESHPESVNITRVVNNHGFVTSETNGENRTTTYGHDPVGRVTSIDRPIGNDISIVYSGATKSTKTTTRGGLVQTVSYDALWRPTTVVRGGITATHQYDAYGRVTFQSNPNDSIGTSTEYDALGRITKVTHPDSTWRSFTYGAATFTERDERANLTTTTYRAYGDPDDALPMSITAPESAANVSLTRDPNGLIRSVTQAGLTRNLDYDTRNYLISETQPETGTTTFERDAAGNMTARTIGGIRTEFTFDGLNHLTGTNFTDSTPDITRTWSKTSKLKTVSSSDAARVLGYDENDNLTSESLTIGATVLAATYGYDGNDRLATITYPVSQRLVNYVPNALGRPTQVSGYATAVTYWPSGQIRQIDYANGTVSTCEQNSRLWPSAFYTRRGSFYSMSSAYGYDGAGNMTSIVDAVDNSMSRTLGYDAIHRLTSATGPWGSGTIGYDGAGNITSQSLGSFNLSYTYNGQNRLASVSGNRSASYGYDASGNVTSAASATYNYDAVPNMRCANCGGGNRTDYTYDGARNRVKVVQSGVTTYEFHAASGDLLVEYTPSQSNRLVEYIYLDGKRIAQHVSDGNAPTSITPTVTNVTVNTSGGFVLGVNIGGSSPSGTVRFMKQGTLLGTTHVVSAQASAEVTGLTAGANTITAIYSGDANHSGNSITYQVTAVIPLPGIPASISVPPNSSTGNYTVEWGGASGWVAAYELYEATNAGFSGQTQAYTGTGSSAQFSGRGNGTYYYRVRACNTAGCSGYQTSGAITVALPPSTPPSISVPTSSLTGSYSISWGSSAIGTVTAYELYEAINGGSFGGTPVYSGASTSTTLSGRGNGTYSYRVRACNGPSCSAYQTGANSISVTLPPSVPGAVVVPAYNNTGSYTVSWGASTGNVTAYELLESVAFGGESLIYSGTATNFARSGKPDGVYGYRLRACNGPLACSAYNATQGNGGVIYVDKIAPTPPTFVGLLSPAYTIYWSGGSTDSAGSGAGSGVGSWRVYRNGSHVGTSNQPQQSYLDSSPPTNVTLNYVVRSVDRAGNESGSSPSYSMYIDTIPPTTPGNFRATSVTTGSVTLAWDPSSDAFGISWYRIARSGSGTVMGNGNPSTSYVDGTVSSNTTYTYQIFAVDGHGVESSPASVTVTTPAGAPPTPTMNGSLFVRNSTGNFTISWSASTGAAYYLLNDGAYTVTGTSKAFSNQGNGEYQFRVKACTSGGLCSGNSATKTVLVCRSGTSCE